MRWAGPPEILSARAVDAGGCARVRNLATADFCGRDFDALRSREASRFYSLEPCPRMFVKFAASQVEDAGRLKQADMLVLIFTKQSHIRTGAAREISFPAGS